MRPWNRFRLHHLVFALVFAGAWLTGEDAGTTHQWLGYGLGLLLLVRLGFALWNVAGFPPLVPPRQFWLYAGTAAVGRALTLSLLLGCLLSAGSGIMLSPAFASAAVPMQAAVQQGDSTEHDEEDEAGEGAGDREESALVEFHEGVTNATAVLVLVHLGWLVLWRRAALRAMVFGTAHT